MALRLSGKPVRDSEGFARTAWILLDWAASAFSTVLITLVVAYVERVVFVDRVWGVSAGVVWAWTLAAAMLVSAVLAPWVAAWADRTRGHKQALLTSVAAVAGAVRPLEPARLAKAR